MLVVSTLILTPSGGAAGEPGTWKESSQERWICGKGQCEFPFLKVLSSGQTFLASLKTLKHEPFELNVTSSNLYCMISPLFLIIHRSVSSVIVHSETLATTLSVTCGYLLLIFFMFSFFLGGGFAHLSACCQSQRDVQAEREGNNSQWLRRPLCHPW